MSINTSALANSPLGKKSDYRSEHAPDQLFTISRALTREEIGISEPLPFHGVDIWNAYELSWLNMNGKPQIGLAEFIIPCTSPNLIESKSLKLYLHSLNQTKFSSSAAVKTLIKENLQKILETDLEINIILADAIQHQTFVAFDGFCLDDLDISCDTYHTEASYLTVTDKNKTISEKLYSNLFRSNCLVTNQPDWGSLFIEYTGAPIDHSGLLRYIVSFRQHNEFHEQCVERIFCEIMHRCQPQQLTVYARYTRRGGLDINPYRSTSPNLPKNARHWRQ